MDIHSQNKALLTPFREALYNFDKSRARSVAANLFAPGAPVHLSHPYNELRGQSALLEAAILPMAQCFPDLERRDYIVIAGEGQPGQNWVGCAGQYLGTFTRPWMSIPATGHLASVRFHEFYRFENGRVVEVQALWDIVDVMKQAHCWPMAPSLGREWSVPGPAGGDGLNIHGDGSVAVGVVRDMLTHRARFAEGGTPAMLMDRFIHPRFNWYGPSGIGSARGLAGYRRWHQDALLRAMPDRTIRTDTGNLIGEGNYAAFTAWPGMRMTLSQDGWLGIPPTGQQLTMRSLDFWRLEGKLIRESWALVDLLDIYAQLGVDVLGRMQEFTKQKGIA